MRFTVIASRKADQLRIRLLEIGEAVKALSPHLLATEPAIPWKDIAAMRDQLAHRYFDTSHAIVIGWSPATIAAWHRTWLI